MNTVQEIEVHTEPQLENTVSVSSQSIDIDTSQLNQLNSKTIYDGFDCSNGAVREKYAWTQSIDDVDVRIPVSTSILKGKQV